MRISFIILCILLGSCAPKIKSSSQISYLFDPKTSELAIKVKLPEGMHAYAPGEPVGRPIELLIHPTNNWVLASPPLLPTGNTKHLLDKDFEIKAKLKNGQGPVSGVFKMQLCSDHSCERPQDYAFEVKY